MCMYLSLLLVRNSYHFENATNRCVACSRKMKAGASRSIVNPDSNTVASFVPLVKDDLTIQRPALTVFAATEVSPTMLNLKVAASHGQAENSGVDTCTQDVAVDIGDWAKASCSSRSAGTPILNIPVLIIVVLGAGWLHEQSSVWSRWQSSHSCMHLLFRWLGVGVVLVEYCCWCELEIVECDGCAGVRGAVKVGCGRQ